MASTWTNDDGLIIRYGPTEQLPYYPEGSTPFGLTPYDSIAGWVDEGPRITKYYVPSTYSTTLYTGDPVVLTGTANAALTFSKYIPGQLQTVTKATAGASNKITGVIVGFESSTGGRLPYGAASTVRVALVSDDPNQVYVIKADGNTTLDATHIGLNAMLNLATSGSTTMGLSGANMDTGTTTAPSATATGQLTILGIDPTPPNAFGQYARFLVRINLHTYELGVAGV
jgi:hypothetical protein